MVNLKKRKKGFTLIELIIVIAIIAILAAVTVPRLTGFRDDAKKKADVANAKIIYNAVNALTAQEKIVKTVTFDVIENEDALTTNPTTNEQKKANAQIQLTSYMETMPTPKLDGTKFIVTIDNESVVITTDADADDNIVSEDNPTVYPVPTTGTYAN